MGKASMRPDDFSDGGGLTDDINVEWGEVRFVDFQYPSGVSAPVLQVTMEDEDGDEHTEIYTVGKGWEVSEDGLSLEGEGGINKNTNLAILLGSMIEEGFPVDAIGDDCSAFEGLKCHMGRIPAPARPGLNKAPRDDGKEYAPTVLVVDAIHSLPEALDGGKKGGKKGGKGGGTKEKKESKKGKEEETGGGDAEEKATEVVMEILGETDKPIKKQLLASKVHAALKGDPDQKAAMKVVLTDEFLEQFEYDAKKGTVSL